MSNYCSTNEIFAGSARIYLGDTPEQICEASIGKVAVGGYLAEAVSINLDITANQVAITDTDWLKISNMVVGTPNVFTQGKIGVLKNNTTGEIFFCYAWESDATGTYVEVLYVTKGISMDKFKINDTLTTYDLAGSAGDDIMLMGVLDIPTSPYETEGDVVISENIDNFKTRTNQSGYVDKYSLILECLITVSFPRNTAPRLMRDILPDEYITSKILPISATDDVTKYSRILGRSSGIKLDGKLMIVFPEHDNEKTITYYQNVWDGTDMSTQEAVTYTDFSNSWIFPKASPGLNKAYNYSEGAQVNLDIEFDALRSDVLDVVGLQGFFGYGWLVDSE